MLSTLIAQRTAEWFQRPVCPARPLIAHIRARGFLRDAQIEAIKTYLFLKIEGGNRPLWQLFCDGFFTQGEDLARVHISEQARAVFAANPAARALFAFARSKSTDGTTTLLPELEAYLRDHAAEADCERIIKDMFYGVTYPDYLFSLPMGAGKTFLMAAFIYLDLYFAQSEPENPIWAHNFILLVPSGLKSSILPSLKTIENFDPTWVLPEPAASNVKKLIQFEMLDQPKSASRSNKARNPNAVKLSSHQPFADLMGLVLVTNAEKVILDRVQISDQGMLIEASEDDKERQANELRSLIGNIPNLQILIDEVHHAATDEVKLRQVVNTWSTRGHLNGVLGFSGTPYLASPESVPVGDGMKLRFSQITNTVFYYPLTRAIETFLKKPTVRTISALDSQAIVRHGVDDFLQQYGNVVYADGQLAKLAIYCGTIERLEDDIYPLLLEMKIPSDEILKYHRGNKQHAAPVGAESEWAMLDTAWSKKRIILLVQIGKEGWDCRSLSGVILSQKGDCPTNMVLQTSCRCLRQIDGSAPNGDRETAGIWLNADNARTLDKQLRVEQHTSIAEINSLSAAPAAAMRQRAARIEHLRLPQVAFYQMRVRYDTLISAAATPRATLAALDARAFHSKAAQVTHGLNATDVIARHVFEQDRGDPADFNAWLLRVSKGSFGALALRDLRAFAGELRPIFDAITYDDAGTRRFNALYDEAGIAARIRLAFQDQRALDTRREIIRRDAQLLIVAQLKEIAADTPRLYPDEADCARMLELDEKGTTSDDYLRVEREKQQAALKLLKESGLGDIVLPALPELSTPVRNKERSFQYVPYRFDSSFELAFLKEALEFTELRERNLELYFNGEGELTEFRIECFAAVASGWSKVGLYSPDFLLVERRDDAFHRALIVETKGAGFAKDFVPRRRFVESEWLRLNNERFGYKRFDFLYLEGDMNDDTRYALVEKVKEFFTE